MSALRRLCVISGRVLRRSVATDQAGVKKNAARPLFLTPIPTYREPPRVQSSPYTGQHEKMYEDIDVYTKSQLPFNTLREEGRKLLMQKAKEKNITLSEEKIAELWDKYMMAREDEAFHKAALMARTLTLTTEEVQNESNKSIEASTTGAEDTLQVPSNEEVNLGSTMSFESCDEAFAEICRRFLLTDSELRDARAFSAHGPPLGQDWVMSEEGIVDLVHWTEQPLVFLPFEIASYEDTNGAIWSLHRGAILDFHQGKIMISEVRERDNEDDEDETVPNEAALFGDRPLLEEADRHDKEDLDEPMDQEMRDAFNNDRYDSAVEELSLDEHGNVDVERTLNRYWNEQAELHPVERDGSLMEKFADMQREGYQEFDPEEAALDAEDEATLAQLSPSEIEALMNEHDDEEQSLAPADEPATLAAPPRKYPLDEGYLTAAEIEQLPGYEFNVDPEIERSVELDTLRDLHRFNKQSAANLSESFSQAIRALNAVELSKPVLDKKRPPLSPVEAKDEELHREATLPIGGTSPFAVPGPMEFIDDTNYRALTGFSRVDMNNIDDVDDFPRNLTRIIDIPSDLLLALKTVPWPKMDPEEQDIFVRFFDVPLTFRDSPLNHNDATYAVEEELQKLNENELSADEFGEDFDEDVKQSY